MKLNKEKFHLIIFGAKKEKVNMYVGKAQIEESYDEKLLGITPDKKLSFKKHVQTLCKKGKSEASCSYSHFNLYGAQETKTVDENIRYVPV